MAEENEVVRRQIEAAIKRKESLDRRLERQIAQATKDLNALKGHRAAVITEINALRSHLVEIGGAIEKPKKGAKRG